MNLSDRTLFMRVGEKVMHADVAKLKKAMAEVRETVAPAVEAYLNSLRKKPQVIDWTKVKTSLKAPMAMGTGLMSPGYKAVLSGSYGFTDKFPVAKAVKNGFLDPDSLSVFTELNPAEAWLMCAALATPQEPVLQTSIAKKD